MINADPPKGVWLGTGTSIHDPYPCICKYDPCRWDKCYDRGRSDNAHLPDHCCGSVASNRRREQTGQQVPAEPGWSTTDVPPKTGRSEAVYHRGSDRAIDMRRSAPAVGDVRSDDLWGPAPALEPAPVYWGAVDEPPEVDDAPGGHSDTPKPARQTPVAADAPRAPSGRPPGAGRAPDCDCPTPWDPPPPVLLIAASPKADGRISQRWELPARHPQGHRALADQLLTQHGYALAKDWEQKRHALIPGRPRMRPCWLAPIPEEAGGGVAVLDMPEPTGNGMHCADCHINAGSAAAFQLHRPSWLSPCKPPASVKTVRHGTPMLVQSVEGVWTVNSRAAWPPGRGPLWYPG